MFAFHITTRYPSLAGLSVAGIDETPSVQYYGTVKLNRDITDEDAETRGLYRKTEASADYDRDASALYAAETRMGA